MVVWLQLSYRQALPLEYWLAAIVRCRPQYADYESKKTKLHNVQVTSQACGQKRVAG